MEILKIYSDTDFLIDDRDVIFVFSQNAARYFTTLIQSDNGTNKIYQIVANHFTGNIQSILDTNNGQDREQKTMNNGNNFNLQPLASSCCQNSHQ